jgi:hypothetical protein
MRIVSTCVGLGLLAAGCGSSGTGTPSDAGTALDLGAPPPYVDAGDIDANKPMVDGGYVGGDGAVVPADRFITKVVSFTPGQCAGFGAAKMPDVVFGPPVGAGDLEGGLDVVSLGIGGEIVVSFEPNAIVDGPGVDFIVFENAFYAAGNPDNVSADPGEVSVSDDGVTWATYPCTATKAPYGACAGWHPVYSSPTNGISPFDPSAAGGDPYDLKDLGVARARFVRIRDKSTLVCDGKVNSYGFDLDAMAIVNPLSP